MSPKELLTHLAESHDEAASHNRKLAERNDSLAEIYGTHEHGAAMRANVPAKVLHGLTARAHTDLGKTHRACAKTHTAHAECLREAAKTAPDAWAPEKLDPNVDPLKVTKATTSGLGDDLFKFLNYHTPAAEPESSAFKIFE